MTMRKGKMSEEIIDSQYLNERMSLKIYTPEGYSPFQRYNICVMQDGNDYYQLGRVASVSDLLHEDGDIEHTIFIGIHYQDKYDRRKKYHPDGEQQQAYSRFLAHEVIPFLDDHFSTFQMGQSRILMGDSLAGTLALITAIKYPHTFGKVIMQSPYIDQTIFQLIEDATDLTQLDIYHTIGTEEAAVHTTDGSVLDFLTPNRYLSERLSNKGVSYEYKELTGGKHTWGYWQKDLPEALKIILS
jgi:enterochelin esterase-like enzyme